MFTSRSRHLYIKAGSATVNGKVVTEMGYQVKPDDEVRFDGSLITQKRKRYVLLNKPKNYITNLEDERGRKTVMELIAVERPKNVSILLDDLIEIQQDYYYLPMMAILQKN